MGRPIGSDDPGHDQVNLLKMCNPDGVDQVMVMEFRIKVNRNVTRPASSYSSSSMETISAQFMGPAQVVH